jgi:hypothetical protein
MEELRAADLTQAIQEALEKEWQEAKKQQLPAAGLEDRRLLFAAVARGLLEYLKKHQDDVLSTITFEDVAGERVTHAVKGAVLNINIGT